MALVLGSFYAVINPPFTVNDELNHVARAYELSIGHLRIHEDAKGPYCEVPRPLRALAKTYGALPRDHQHRVSVRQLMNSLSTPLEDTGTWHLGHRLPVQTPLSYSAIVPGVWLARSLSLPALWLVYLPRFTGLLAFSALIYLALSYAQSLAWALLALALMPALLAQAGGASPESLIAALSFLFLAIVEKEALAQEEPLQRKQRVAVIALLMYLVCCEPACVLFALTLPMLRWRAVDTRAARWGYAALGALVSYGAYAALAYAAGQRPLALTTTAQAQLGWLISHPFNFIWTLTRTTFRRLDDYTLQFFVVRDLLSNQMRFSAGAIAVLQAELIVLLALGCTRGLPSSVYPKARWYITPVALYIFWIFLRGLLLTDTKIGPGRLQNIQGHFFLPMAPFLVAALARVGQPIARRWFVRRGGVRVIVAATFLNLVWLFFLWARYYADNRRPWKY